MSVGLDQVFSFGVDSTSAKGKRCQHPSLTCEIRDQNVISGAWEMIELDGWENSWLMSLEEAHKAGSYTLSSQ